MCYDMRFLDYNESKSDPLLRGHGKVKQLLNMTGPSCQTSEMIIRNFFKTIMKVIKAVMKDFKRSGWIRSCLRTVSPPLPMIG